MFIVDVTPLVAAVSTSGDEPTTSKEAKSYHMVTCGIINIKWQDVALLE